MKIHLSITVCVQDVNDPSHKRVLLQLRDAHELVNRERPVLIEVELLEASAETTNLIHLNCNPREERKGEGGRRGREWEGGEEGCGWVEGWEE